MTVHFGILGAARIADAVLIRPSRLVAEATVHGIASRDTGKSMRFANRNNIVAYPDYESLIQSSRIDAIYIPLINSQHCEWSVKALRAGKHVLCEKPIANNLAETRKMVEAASVADKILFEGMHYLDHPFMSRVRALVSEMKNVSRIDAKFCLPLVNPGNHRFDYECGGGALMDLGCYCINAMRFIANSAGFTDEPTVTGVNAKCRSTNVDRFMSATMQWKEGLTGGFQCSLFSRHLYASSLSVTGEDGSLSIYNPFLPHQYNFIRGRIGKTRISETIRAGTTYTHQLQAFLDCIDKKRETNLVDAIATMKLIDDIYQLAGLPVRGMSDTIWK
jgi:predicted dehydrogenase